MKHKTLKETIQDITEGKEQDTYIDGYKTMIATLNQFLKTAKSAALKKEIENQIEFWKNKIKALSEGKVTEASRSHTHAKKLY